MTSENNNASIDEVQQKVRLLQEELKAKALNLVNTVMPTKVIQLSDLYKNSTLINKPLKQIEQSIELPEEGAQNKKRKLEGGEAEQVNSTKVPSNTIIVSLLNTLKLEVLELIETINTVKIWIQLNIPKIEDGNNFGVSIQEETVSELGRAEDNGYVTLDNMTKYYITRAKLVSKVLKYPNVEDYRHSVADLDEKEFVNMKLCCLDLRNNYAILHDMITKNLEKIRTPRSSQHHTVMF